MSSFSFVMIACCPIDRRQTETIAINGNANFMENRGDTKIYGDHDQDELEQLIRE